MILPLTSKLHRKSIRKIEKNFLETFSSLLRENGERWPVNMKFVLLMRKGNPMLSFSDFRRSDLFHCVDYFSMIVQFRSGTNQVQCFQEWPRNSPSSAHALPHLIFCKVNSLAFTSLVTLLSLPLAHVTFEGNNMHSLFSIAKWY